MKTLLLSLALLSACAHAPVADDLRIIDKPVPFPESRVQLTRDYIRSHYGLNVDSITIVPRVIVLHWTAGSTFSGSYNTFVPETLGGGRPDLARTSDLNVAIQFLVDRDGTIYRLMPETWMARHVIGLNYSAIGVENVGGAGGKEDLTEAQAAANSALVRYLAKKYPTIQYLIGHHEYRLMENTPLWLERDTTYRTVKSDPGDAFMTTVRRAVADLKLRKPE